MTNLLVLVILTVLLGTPTYVIGERRGVKNPWAAFIPGIGPALVLLWSIGRSGWLILCSFVPIVNLIFGVWLLFTVPATHRRSSLWGFGLMVPVVGVWAYAFTLDRFQSPLTTWNLRVAGFEPRDHFPGLEEASYPAEARVAPPDPAPFPTTGQRPLRPLIIFGVIVGVGLLLLAVGLRMTDHPAKAYAAPTRLSRERFVRAGNGVCDRYYRDGRRLITSQPKTVRMLTKNLRLSIPLMAREAAGLRALVPPRSDAATYRLLLSLDGQEIDAAHRVLHALETGQVRRGVLVARYADHLDRRLNTLSRRLGLTVCGLTGRQVRARYG